MSFLADLHTHSKYARACSPRLTLPNMSSWCQLKGVDVLSAADFTHPQWFAHLEEMLEEAGEGIYAVKPDHLQEAEITVPESCQRNMRFVLGSEISLIYKKGDRVRRIHLVVLAPSFEVVQQINAFLGQRFNLHADGRPILGIDAEELMKHLMEISTGIEVIPAHVWTPHFGIFGSKSGFDSLEECFGSMSSHIHALETGMSSDPPMNWRLSQNDSLVLVSNSDAHSPQKFGREATLFAGELSYSQILKALREDHELVEGTIEFFPQEGKYYGDGLRKEKLYLDPAETKQHQFASPGTGKPVTVGVLHRIDDLADRPLGESHPSARPYWHIIPLPEILGEILGVGSQSKTVEKRYFELLEQLGPEFAILKDLPISRIAEADEVLAEAIRRMREKEVIIQPGYDGVYGVIRLFEEGELNGDQPFGQMGMF